MSKHSKHKHSERIPLSLLELLEEKIDEDKILRGVELSEDDLLNSAFKQPELYWMVGRLRVQAMSKRAKREMELESVRADVGLRLRHKQDDKGKRKFTEPHVKAQTELDSRVVSARKKLMREIKFEEATKQLLDVYKQRKEIIQIVTFAGKISLHMRELELIKGNKRLRRAVENIRQNWKNPVDNDED